MRTIFLYRPVSEYSTEVDSFIREVTRRYPAFNAETKDIDQPDGIELARIYDITSYPTIMVTKDDGELVQMWQGMPLPMIDELAAYALESKV